ncbi:Tdc2 [Cordylochernes scorpioides]|uniref:Tdc2 n=1 Tax=Cordylochernes scorpioides TaxID=51811 RepID=A0ABY6L419_9ARAC|nr:Tdc2 [Cordylochernes scorpioides]
MDADEFRQYGREAVEYVADYVTNLDQRPVMPKDKPGVLRSQLPQSPPAEPHAWPTIFRDFNDTIMPQVAHWQSPHFHAYFPSGASFPSLLGGLIGDAISSIGFSWQSSPAGTELEIVVMNWLGKMIGLPKEFLMQDEQSEGGGVIQGSASECVLLALLAARHEALNHLAQCHPGASRGENLNRLVAYCSEQTHSCMEKAALIGLVKLRKLDTDCRCRLRGNVLAKAIECCATLGTTGSCAYDPLRELGPVCRREGLWLHVDAAYAGCSFICPELRRPFRGVEVGTRYLQYRHWKQLHLA